MLKKVDFEGVLMFGFCKRTIYSRWLQRGKLCMGEYDKPT